MATFTWQAYIDTPGWTDVDSSTFVFSGSQTDLTVPITVNTWNSGTHIGDGDPGSDQCGATHVPNVEYVGATQFKLNGGTTEDLNDTNLIETECTIKILFTDASSVETTNARFYCFDGTTETDEAIGVEVYAFEQGISETTWDYINDSSTGFGGDNSGHYLPLDPQSSAQDHTFFVAVTARPESVGTKTQFDFGVALTYS